MLFFFFFFFNGDIYKQMKDISRTPETFLHRVSLDLELTVSNLIFQQSQGPTFLCFVLFWFKSP